MDATAIINFVPDSTGPIVSGCVAFGTTLCLSTLAQKIVGVSTVCVFLLNHRCSLSECIFLTIIDGRLPR
jgi:hypothetical protein